MNEIGLLPGILFSLGQGVFLVIMLSLPGVAVLSAVNKGRLPGWPLALLLSGSCAISTVLLAVWELLASTMLSPAHGTLAAFAAAGLVLTYGVFRGFRLLWQTVRSCSTWEKRALGLLGIVVLFWIGTMPLSPYPSHFSLNLGDPVLYYRAAFTNIAGRGWEPDYYVGDYLGGAITYLSTHPIPTLVTSLLFRVFGVNPWALNIYSSLAGALLLYLLATVMCSVKGAHSLRGKGLFYCLLALLAVPAHFVFFGVGTVTCPGALLGLTILGLYLLPERSSAARAVALATCFLGMILMRPESAMFAVLLGACYACGGFLSMRRVTPIGKVIAVAAVLGLCAVAWVSLPRILAVHDFKSLWINFIRYDTAEAGFKAVCEPWHDVNRIICRANFQGVDPHQLIVNPNVADELRAHPFAFLRFLMSHFPRMSYHFLRAVTCPFGLFWTMYWRIAVPGAAVLSLLLAVAFFLGDHKMTALATALFIALLPLANMAAELRHLFVVSPLILALAVRGLLKTCHLREALPPRSARAGQWLLVVSAFGLLIICGVLLVNVRRNVENRSYVPIFRDLRKLTEPGESIASSAPQLICGMTDRPSIGSTWLVEMLPLIVKRFRIDYVLVDNARDGPKNYDLLKERQRGTIPGYELVLDNKEHSYAIYRAVKDEQ